MESRKHLAAEKKRLNTHNCAQSVVCTYCDLVGLEAVDEQGQAIGTLADVLQPGANDVYEIKTPKGMMYLAALPFVIKHVDAKAGIIVVDETRLPEVAVFED